MANKSDMDIAFLGVLHLCVFAKMSPLAPATRKTFPALKNFCLIFWYLDNKVINYHFLFWNLEQWGKKILPQSSSAYNIIASQLTGILILHISAKSKIEYDFWY